MDNERSLNFCPRCLQETLTDYFDEDSGVTHGTKCDNCGYRGMYVNGRLRELVTA